MSVDDPKAIEKTIIENVTKITDDHISFRPVIMPECADLYLSQIYKENYEHGSLEIYNIFKEYFSRKIKGQNSEGESLDTAFPQHRFYWGLTNSRAEISKIFESMCSIFPDDKSEYYHPQYGPKGQDIHRRPYNDEELRKVGQLDCCVPCSSLNLWGDRRLKSVIHPDNFTPEVTDNTRRLNKLFIADVLWLFFFDRMGIFKIVAGILDDYANSGKYPISSNNFTSLIIEMLIRDVKRGTASTVRDRASTYARSLGWKLTTKLTDIDPEKIFVNNGFSKLFHKFINLALRYYKEKRLAETIEEVRIFKSSTTTVIEIEGIISLLINTIKTFQYGRNYYNTLNGIIWLIAGLDLIYRTRDSFGIPLNYKSPEQLIPAAYSIIVEKKSINSADANRFKLHYECAQDSRDILIDIEAGRISENPNTLSSWLNIIEPRIEGYRTAYKGLTGIDLEQEGSLNIEQEI
ncbi:MAG TPA: hypothetical protein VK250_04510 [Nitrososphaeraceae archaeon]|nr:hypothetical protein [Nitrososphaeraceae archaeon]